MGDVCGDYCCVGDCGDCCVGKKRLEKARIHENKIASELAEIRNTMNSLAERQERILRNAIDQSMKKFLSETLELNQKEYSGKHLNINIDLLVEKHEELKAYVDGCIRFVLEKRLVQADRELCIILQEKDDEKRKKATQAFADKVYQNATEDFVKKIEINFAQQSDLIKNEINVRLREVDQSVEKSMDSYKEMMELKQKDSQKAEEKQVVYMYRIGLCNLLEELIL